MIFLLAYCNFSVHTFGAGAVRMLIVSNDDHAALRDVRSSVPERNNYSNKDVSKV